MPHFPEGTSPETVGLPSNLEHMTIAEEYAMGTAETGHPVLVLGNGPMRLVKILSDEVALQLAANLIEAVLRRTREGDGD